MTVTEAAPPITRDFEQERREEAALSPSVETEETIEMTVTDEMMQRVKDALRAEVGGYIRKAHVRAEKAEAEALRMEGFRDEVERERDVFFRRAEKAEADLENIRDALGAGPEADLMALVADLVEDAMQPSPALEAARDALERILAEDTTKLPTFPSGQEIRTGPCALIAREALAKFPAPSDTGGRG